MGTPDQTSRERQRRIMSRWADYHKNSKHKPCARPGCPNRTKRATTIYCSRRCGFLSKSRRKITINNLKAEQPKVETSSWWTSYDTFYSEARKRFPLDSKPIFSTAGWGQ